MISICFAWTMIILSGLAGAAVGLLIVFIDTKGPHDA